MKTHSLKKNEQFSITKLATVQNEIELRQYIRKVPQSRVLETVNCTKIERGSYHSHISDYKKCNASKGVNIKAGKSSKGLKCATKEKRNVESRVEEGVSSSTYSESPGSRQFDRQSNSSIKCQDFSKQMDFLAGRDYELTNFSSWLNGKPDVFSEMTRPEIFQKIYQEHQGIL